MSLPVPLSPFEHYMLTDDSRDYPMCFAFRLLLDGVLDRPKFEAAVAFSVKRHPLLNANVIDAQTKPGDLLWVTAKQPPVVDWCNEDGLEVIRPIDLQYEAGLRITVIEAANSCRVTFQIHHACCDGLGACQFIEDVLVAYHNAAMPSGSNQLQHPTLDEAALAQRGDVSGTRSRGLAKIVRIGRGISRTVAFLLRQPVALQGHSVSPEQQSDESPQLQHRNCSDHRFEADVLTKLKSETTAGVMTNDRLLAIAFETLLNWQTNSTTKSWLWPRPIRIGVPVNLRRQRHRNLSAANVVSVTYLDRKAAHARDTNRLLTGINQQMTGIKARKSGTFVRFMHFVGQHDWLKKLVSGDRVFLTATFSNLGAIFSKTRLRRNDSGEICFADLVVRDIDVQGPVRSTMTVFFVVFTYAKRLKSCLAFAPKKFSATDADALHRDFIERVTAIEGTDVATKAENSTGDRSDRSLDACPDQSKPASGNQDAGNAEQGVRTSSEPGT